MLAYAQGKPKHPNPNRTETPTTSIPIFAPTRHNTPPVPPKPQRIEPTSALRNGFRLRFMRRRADCAPRLAQQVQTAASAPPRGSPPAAANPVFAPTAPIPTPAPDPSRTAATAAGSSFPAPTGSRKSAANAPSAQAKSPAPRDAASPAPSAPTPTPHAA